MKSNTANRIEYIDCLRGTTMIFVVFSHVALFLFGWWRRGTCPPNDILILVRMPLFYFIMGLFAFLPYKQGWQATLSRRFKSRLLCQLIPTVIVLMLYIYTFDITLDEIAFDEAKSGYWFTWVAFQFFLLYAVLASIFHLLKLKPGVQSVLLIMIALLSQPLKTVYPINNTPELLQLFSVYKSLSYLPCFFAGIIAGMYFGKLEELLQSKVVTGALLVMFLIPFWLPYSLGYQMKFLQSFSGLFLLLSLFQQFSRSFSLATTHGRLLSFVGHYTLEIYLLHYFVIKWLADSRIKELAPYMAGNWLLQLIGTLIVSVAIVSAVMMFLVLLRRVCSPVYKLLFGKVNTATL